MFGTKACPASGFAPHMHAQSHIAGHAKVCVLLRFQYRYWRQQRTFDSGRCLVAALPAWWNLTPWYSKGGTNDAALRMSTRFTVPGGERVLKESKADQQQQAMSCISVKSEVPLHHRLVSLYRDSGGCKVWLMLVQGGHTSKC